MLDFYISAGTIRFMLAYSWFILSFAPIAVDYAERPAVISWHPTYPRTGQLRGSIIVKGVVFTNKGWKVPQKKVKVEIWPRGGGVALFFEADVKNGVWGPSTIAGLSSGDSYNVVVVVPLTSQSTRTALITDPQIVPAR